MSCRLWSFQIYLGKLLDFGCFLLRTRRGFVQSRILDISYDFINYMPISADFTSK